MMTGIITQPVRESLRNLLPDYIAVNLLYYRVFRRLPDLKHPKTFNEKIAWRKLYQHNPLFPLFSDKLAVKAEIARLIGERHIIETLWSGDTPEAIPFDDLAPPYVVKVNHSTGGSLFVRTPQERQARDDCVVNARATSVVAWAPVTRMGLFENSAQGAN